MSQPLLIARLDDEASISAISSAVTAWEPRLSIVAAAENPMIYEPDGTLYAAAVPPASTLVSRHKSRPFLPGDVAVIPRSVAIDAEAPGASYVAVLHDGPPPYHFRERFIQTWGYEHRSPSRTDEGAQEEAIPEGDPRFRVSYRLVSIHAGARPFESRIELQLWVVLEGFLSFAAGSSADNPARCSGELILIPPGVAYSVEGTGVGGRFLLEAEQSFESRLARALADRGQGLSPEFRVG